MEVCCACWGQRAVNCMFDVKAFAKRFWEDSGKVKALALPAISALGTLAKFLGNLWGVPEMKYVFDGISYAWALLPITIGLAVAYCVRLHEYNLVTASPVRDTLLADGVFYLVKARWPKTDDKLITFEEDEERRSSVEMARAEGTPEYTLLSERLQSLRQAAFDGKVTIWGVPHARNELTAGVFDEPSPAAIYKPIPKDHWEKFRVPPRLFLIYQPRKIHTSPPDDRDYIDVNSYCDLQVSKNQIELLARHLVTKGKPSAVTGRRAPSDGGRHGN